MFATAGPATGPRFFFTKNFQRDEVPHLQFFPAMGAGVTPAEGSLKPTAGFKLN
jgi:hypothetical protein